MVAAQTEGNPLSMLTSVRQIEVSSRDLHDSAYLGEDGCSRAGRHLLGERRDRSRAKAFSRAWCFRHGCFRHGCCRHGCFRHVDAVGVAVFPPQKHASFRPVHSVWAYVLAHPPRPAGGRFRLNGGAYWTPAPAPGPACRGKCLPGERSRARPGTGKPLRGPGTRRLLPHQVVGKLGGSSVHGRHSDRIVDDRRVRRHLPHAEINLSDLGKDLAT